MLPRADVAKKRKMTKGKVEVKRFRAEARACRLGDPGQTKMCKRPEGQCRLCTALRTGFKYSLHYKRNFAQRGVGYAFFSTLVAHLSSVTLRAAMVSASEAVCTWLRRLPS